MHKYFTQTNLNKLLESNFNFVLFLTVQSIYPVTFIAFSDSLH